MVKIIVYYENQINRTIKPRETNPGMFITEACRTQSPLKHSATQEGECAVHFVDFVTRMRRNYVGFEVLSAVILGYKAV
jgi:hypothetical protein